MPKRPSASSTRARQRQVSRYVFSTDVSTTARHFGVSPEQVEKFISTNPKKLKGRLNRSPAYKRMYSADPKNIAKQHKVKLVPKLTSQTVHKLEQRDVPVTERQRRAVDYFRATRVRSYRKSKEGKVTYRPITQVSSAQAVRQAGYTGYSTINSVQAGYRSGQLSAEDVHEIVGLWQKLYGDKSRVNFDDLEESILELEVDEEFDDGEN